MRASIKLALIAVVVAGIAYMAQLPAFPPPTKYGDVAKAECLREAGRDLNSQQACVTTKLLGKYVEEKFNSQKR